MLHKTLVNDFCFPLLLVTSDDVADVIWPSKCGKREEGLDPETAIVEIEAALSECVSTYGDELSHSGSVASGASSEFKNASSHFSSRLLKPSDSSTSL